MTKKRQSLTIERIIPFVPIDPMLAPPIRIIWLIGVGGTGSLLAASLARMLYHFSQSAQDGPFGLILMDGDVVEEGNIGRQNFAPWDVGLSKAEILAARYNTALGTRIEAIPSYFSSHLATDIAEVRTLRQTLIVSAVDNNAARRDIASFIADTRKRYGIKLLWADVGNEAFTGQLVVGNTFDPADVREAIRFFRRKKAHYIYSLPTVLLVHPEMSDPESDTSGQTEPRPSCAMAMQQDTQSLPVNDMAARIAANAVYSILKSGSLRYFAVYFDCKENCARPLYNTAANLKRILTTIHPLRPLGMSEVA